MTKQGWFTVANFWFLTIAHMLGFLIGYLRESGEGIGLLMWVVLMCYLINVMYSGASIIQIPII